MREIPLFEAAQQLHTTTDRVRRMLTLGLLAGGRRGNRLYVEVNSIEKYLNGDSADAAGQLRAG